MASAENHSHQDDPVHRAIFARRHPTPCDRRQIDWKGEHDLLFRTMTGLTVVVRPAEEGDLDALNHIYNRYVAETHFTFDIEPMIMEARREWFSHYDRTGRYRLLVAAADNA